MSSLWYLPAHPSSLRQSWNPQDTDLDVENQSPLQSSSGPVLHIDETGRATVQYPGLVPLAFGTDSSFAANRLQAELNHTDTTTPTNHSSPALPDFDTTFTPIPHSCPPTTKITNTTPQLPLPNPGPAPQSIQPPTHPSLLTPYPPSPNSQFFILNPSLSSTSPATYTPLPPPPTALTHHPLTNESLYYLTPTPTIVRACASRLLAVRYKCGDVVILKEGGNEADIVRARVLRRYVEKGERRYDLFSRDGMRGVWRDVGEGDIEGLWTNGNLDSGGMGQVEAYGRSQTATKPPLAAD